MQLLKQLTTSVMVLTAKADDVQVKLEQKVTQVACVYTYAMRAL